MDNPYQSPRADSQPIAPAGRATACPHCGEAAVSLFLKSRMGPFRDRECRRCGGRIGIGWRWGLISSLAGLTVPLASVAAVLLLADAEGRVVPDEFWQSNRLVISVGVVAGVSMLGGGIQVVVQTLGAPLVKKPAKERPGR